MARRGFAQGTRSTHGRRTIGIIFMEWLEEDAARALRLRGVTAGAICIKQPPVPREGEENKVLRRQIDRTPSPLAVGPPRHEERDGSDPERLAEERDGGKE